MSAVKELWAEHGIGWLLDQWGLYLNQPGIGIGYPAASAFVRAPALNNSVIIDDELVHEINIWMQDLKNSRRMTDPQKADVIEQHHMRRKSFVKISDEMRMSRPSLMLIYAQATAWIDSKVDDYYKLSSAKRRAIKILLKSG